MQKYIFLTIVFLLLTNKSYCSGDQSLETLSSEQVIEVIANAQNSMPRNENGLIPIDETLSLLSSVKKGTPPYILSTYIVNTITFKMYLVPYITATTKKQFNDDLERTFKEYLNSYKDYVQEDDFSKYCSEETREFLQRKKIKIQKDFRDEDNKLLFTVFVDSSFCKQYVAQQDLNIKKP